MKLIDRIGTFLFTVAESGLGESAKGYPQWVARLVATKYYVTTKEDMAHFQMTEAGYVDWNFDEGIFAYMVLFNDNGPLKNYEQIQAATGWDGQDFATLSDQVGKTILGRVEENDFNNKISLQVNWVDAATASPERTLRSVDADKAKALTSKFLAGMKKPAAPVAAKPATPGPKAPPAAATPATASSPPSPSTTPTATTPAAPVAEAPKRKKTAQPPVAAPAPVVTAPPVSAPPSAPPVVAPAAPANSCTKMAAWEYVNTPAVKRGNDDTVIEGAWIAATQEIGANVEEAAFTNEMWAQVRDIVVKDLT